MPITGSDKVRLHQVMLNELRTLKQRAAERGEGEDPILDAWIANMEEAATDTRAELSKRDGTRPHLRLVVSN